MVIPVLRAKSAMNNNIQKKTPQKTIPIDISLGYQANIYNLCYPVNLIYETL